MGWLGAVGGFLGGLYANQEAKRSAKRQMEFQATMSNTSYQRAMADMKAAGLNPMLAYKMGGASTPAGAMYNPVNVGMAATDGYLKGEQAQLASAQQAKTVAETGLTEAQTRKITAEVEQQIPAVVRKLDAEGDLARAGVSVKEAEATLKDLTIKLTRMDIKALEKLGLSPMQLKHTPFNQLGSLLIDKVIKFWEGTGFDKSVGYMTTPELEQALDQAFSQESP